MLCTAVTAGMPSQQTHPQGEMEGHRERDPDTRNGNPARMDGNPNMRDTSRYPTMGGASSGPVAMGGAVEMGQQAPTPGNKQIFANVLSAGKNAKSATWLHTSGCEQCSFHIWLLIAGLAAIFRQ